jgi:hypothetical protein
MRTRGTARILCRLIDGSSVVLAPETTLTIVQSRYNPTRKTGLSFLYLKHGSARFNLSSPSDLSAYKYKVQTDMVSVFSREADFVVQTSSEATEIIAFENSLLEVTGMAQPEDVISLSGLQRVFVSKKIISPTVEALSRGDIETVMADFHSAPQITLLADGANEKAADNKSEETMVEEGIIEIELTQ